MTQTAIALVLGASGGIGGERARQLRDAGWQVRALQRGLAATAEQRDGIDWRRGDAMQRHDVLQATRGCTLIVHAANPPGYRRWSELVLPMLDNSIAAARAEGATSCCPAPSTTTAPTPIRRRTRMRRRRRPAAKARSGSKWSNACKPPPRTTRGC